MGRRELNIGLLGYGVVGKALVHLLTQNQETIQRRTGLSIRIQKIFCRHTEPTAPYITHDPEDIFSDPSIHIVVELIGGVEPAYAYLQRAMMEGKSVITANKALLSRFGHRLMAFAIKHRVQMGIEASVCAGIPILRVIRDGLVGNHISTLCGILNSTSNFVLTRMAESNMSFAEALVGAQQYGFSEPDPTLDIDGIDAAQKLVILSELAFNARIPYDHIVVDGISQISGDDIRYASELGYTIRHLALTRRVPEGLDVRVHPALLPKDHPLASIRYEDNAIMLRGDGSGELILQGKGSGAYPAASSVIADIVDMGLQSKRRLFAGKTQRLPILSQSESRFYMRFPILDRPGVMGLITTALGKQGISIGKALAMGAQPNGRWGDAVVLVHRCQEAAIKRAVEEIAQFSILNGRPVLIRIFDPEQDYLPVHDNLTRT